jgi:ABC-type uncharacterized transport system permease subunit
VNTVWQRIGIRGSAESRRAFIVGIFLIIVGGLILLLFARGITWEQITTFDFHPTGVTQAIEIQDQPIPTMAVLYACALICVFVGFLQLAHVLKRADLAIGIVAVAFVLAFLAWGARDRTLQITDLLKIALLRAVPIAFAGLSGVLCERCAVINIAIEGMMLTGAFFASMMGSIALHIWGMPSIPSMIVGLVGAMLVGGLLGLLLAVLAVRFKVDQIIAGTAINILAVGLTSFLAARILSEYQQTLNNPDIFQPVAIPGLASIPVIGPIFFEQNPLVYLLFILLIGVHVMLFYTPWGLRTRAVGEHPRAADTLGINVFKTRYINVVLGGMVAGIGGAFFILGAVGRFDEVMTAGRGFIGLAAMIFGNWMPSGIFGAALIFGFAAALEARLTVLGVGIPPQIMAMVPYLVTMIALAGIVGEVAPPAADGQVYEKQ